MAGLGLRRRELLLFFCVAGALGALAVRLFWLQVVQNGPLGAMAVQTRTRVIPVAAPRGPVWDRNGRPLAVSHTVDAIYANPAEVRDKAATAQALATALDRPEAPILTRLRQRSLFTWIARRAPDAQALAVRRLRLRGVYLTQNSQRVYPQGSLGAQVIGFAGSDNQGLAGVEYSYNRELAGVPGRIVDQYDARNQRLPQVSSSYVAPKPGDGLQLTLDENLQYIVQRDLVRGVLAHGARGGSIIMMDPRNGQILAMATYPTFDPNDFAAYDPALWRNPVISDTLPPGSVFKPVTAAAALNSGVITANTGFYDPGFLRVPGATIHNWNSAGKGATTFREGFRDSANVVFAQTGLRVGVERFYEYLRTFGLLSRTGVDLPGEGLGIFPAEARVKPLDLAIMSFGQTMTVTPIGMVAAMAAAINGGVWMTPHVGRALFAPDGSLIRDIGPAVERRVISPQTSAVLRSLMAGVVEAGTGKRAQLPGYGVGGKTGTTNKVVGGIVSRQHYVGSFMGFVPLADPRVLVYVMVDEPSGEPYGGFVAAPIFRSIMTDALRYLAIPPDRPLRARPPASEGNARVPSVVNLTPEGARARTGSAGLDLLVEGTGPRIRHQIPPAGARVQQGTLVLGYTSGYGQRAVVPVTVPDVRGLSLEGAADALAPLGLVLDAAGSGVVEAQTPAPGERVEPGSTVSVELGAGET